MGRTVLDREEKESFVDELEKRNLEVVKLWAETYNNDVDRMVNECYAENCKVSSMFGGAIIEGRPRFLKLNQRVVNVAPRRNIPTKRTHAMGDVVGVEP